MTLGELIRQRVKELQQEIREVRDSGKAPVYKSRAIERLTRAIEFNLSILEDLENKKIRRDYENGIIASF